MAHTVSSVFDVSPVGGFMCALLSRKKRQHVRDTEWLSIFNLGALASTSLPPASCSFCRALRVSEKSRRPSGLIAEILTAARRRAHYSAQIVGAEYLVLMASFDLTA